MDLCFRCTYWNNCYIKSSFSEWRSKEVILKLHILEMRKPNARRKVTLPKDTQFIKAQLNQNSLCRLSRVLCFMTRLSYIEFCLTQQKYSTSYHYPSFSREEELMLFLLLGKMKLFWTSLPGHTVSWDFMYTGVKWMRTFLT